MKARAIKSRAVAMLLASPQITLRLPDTAPVAVVAKTALVVRGHIKGYVRVRPSRTAP